MQVTAVNRILLLMLSMLPAIGLAQLPPIDVAAALVTNQTVSLTWQVPPKCMVFVPTGGSFPPGCPTSFSIYRGPSEAALSKVGGANPTPGAQFPPHAAPISGVNWLPLLLWPDPAPALNAAAVYRICAGDAPLPDLSNCVTTASVTLVGVPPGSYIPAALVALPAASPATGVEAIGTFANRAQAYLENMACGREFEFLHDIQQGHFDTKQISNGQGVTDGLLTFALAKVQWLKLNPGRSCTSPLPPLTNLGAYEAFIPLLLPSIPYLTARCGTDGITFSSGTPSAPTVSVSANCLQAEANYALRAIRRGYALPGTNGLPCNLGEAGTVTGDWDFRMKPLMRILFLDQMPDGRQGPPVLSDTVGSDGFLIPPDFAALSTSDYIKQQLITVSGSAGPDSYAWEACGDNENDTGSAQDREDEHDVIPDILNSLGGDLTWLLRRLLFILIVLGIAGVFAAAALAWGTIAQVVAVVVLTVVALAGILTLRIPETENHRLMTESTRFLNNQLIIAELGADNAPHVVGGQQDVKTWLLQKFHDIATQDFSEYNARPYHGFSVEALRNLADFSTDPDVRTGAAMLLDFSAAKYALGSSEARRQVPFRRHFALTDCLDGGGCKDLDDTLQGNTQYPDMFDDFYQMGDSEVSEGLLFYGQGQQLPLDASKSYRLLPRDSFTDPVSDAFVAATALYLPDPMIAEIAINKSRPYYQRIHHAGYEIYSSGPAALITAGGIKAAHATEATVAGVDVIGPTDNLGSGVPTSIMIHNDLYAPTTHNLEAYFGPWRSMQKFFSFRGTHETDGGEGTFTDNLCVWQNFACGTNLQIPNDIFSSAMPNGGPCLQMADAHQNWYFLDSASCLGYEFVPHFVMVLYLVCDGPKPGCIAQARAPVASDKTVTAGFIEIVDAPTASLGEIKAATLATNRLDANGDIPGLGSSCVTGGTCRGVYSTFGGSEFGNHQLTLQLRGHLDDATSTGVMAIDGATQASIADWGLASGDILQYNGSGVITIKSPTVNATRVLNFSDQNHPCLQTSPSGPCGPVPQPRR
jgi:hypothetical protein